MVEGAVEGLAPSGPQSGWLSLLSSASLVRPLLPSPQYPNMPSPKQIVLVSPSRMSRKPTELSRYRMPLVVGLPGGEFGGGLVPVFPR